MRAADVVVTKPGYGIIAECLANDTAIVYTSRGEFAEYDVLVDGAEAPCRGRRSCRMPTWNRTLGRRNPRRPRIRAPSRSTPLAQTLQPMDARPTMRHGPRIGADSPGPDT